MIVITGVVVDVNHIVMLVVKIIRGEGMSIRLLKRGRKDTRT